MDITVIKVIFKKRDGYHNLWIEADSVSEALKKINIYIYHVIDAYKLKIQEK